MLYQRNALAVIWNISALRVSMKLLRLRVALFKAGYHPDQPRVPAGSAIGGQWVGAGTADRIRVAVSAFDNPGLYYIDLDKEELRGGHPVTKHVGKGNNYLLNYQIVWQAAHPNSSHPAEGSFNSIGEANNLVSQTLRSNPDAVQRVIDGQEQRAKIILRLDYITGREAYLTEEMPAPIIRPTFWVEVLIARTPGVYPGYRVVTAYPSNNIPNEEFTR